MKTALKDRCYTLLRKIGQTPDHYAWEVDDAFTGKILVNCLENDIEKFNEKDIQDFNGENGMKADPTNWCYSNIGKDFFCQVVSNDWRSLTLKYDNQIFFKVWREMIYDYSN